jgi:hypothetical protein
MHVFFASLVPRLRYEQPPQIPHTEVFAQFHRSAFLPVFFFDIKAITANCAIIGCKASTRIVAISKILVMLALIGRPCPH